MKTYVNDYCRVKVKTQAVRNPVWTPIHHYVNPTLKQRMRRMFFDVMTMKGDA